MYDARVKRAGGFFMNKSNIVEYDRTVDMLHVYDAKEETYGSVTVGNFVIDINADGKIIGLEVDNASQAFPLKAQELEKIESAELNTQTMNGVIMLRINFKPIHFQQQLAIPKNTLPLSC